MPQPAQPPAPEALSALGWGAFQDEALAELPKGTGEPARVVAVHRGSYRAVAAGEDGRAVEHEARPSGRLLYVAGSPAELPAVGDWVLLKPAEDSSTRVVSAILPRRTAFARRAPGKKAEAQVLAANVDTAFIVGAAGRDWNPRRIERYLSLAREAGVQPVIVVTKADLAGEPELLLREAEVISAGGPAVATSAIEGRGLEGLAPFLGAGRTVVLLGSSGAGKSTLLNALAGRELASTGEVREDDERGRHTTTHRELFALPSGSPAAGALVIDTPGLREVQLWAGEEAVEGSFADIDALAASCRFRDCAHGEEPGCAVRESLESGELDRGRWTSWRKLMREAAFLDRKEDVNLARAESERWRTINKSMRGYTKERRSIQGRSR